MQSVLQNRPASDHRHETTLFLSNIYGRKTSFRIFLSAAEVEKLDTKWKKIWAEEIKSLTEWIVEKALRTGQLDLSYVDFGSVVMRHSLEVMDSAIKDSIDFLPPIPGPSRLSAPPKAKVPKTFKELRILWDKFRKMKYIPQRQRAIAERVRREYLRRVQDEWVKHGEGFRSGDTAVRTEAVNAIMKGAEVAYERAKMIVETETTYFYNKTRRAVFDESNDVTHYLFMAIRDHRTTAWCKSRHGLVYSKEDYLLKRETPPIHWNCRSEILPLTEHNPRHKALIEDQSRQRRRNKCEPLPPEWEGRH